MLATIVSVSDHLPNNVMLVPNLLSINSSLSNQLVLITKNINKLVLYIQGVRCLGILL